MGGRDAHLYWEILSPGPKDEASFLWDMGCRKLMLVSSVGIRVLSHAALGTKWQSSCPTEVRAGPLISAQNKLLWGHKSCGERIPARPLESLQLRSTERLHLDLRSSLEKQPLTRASFSGRGQDMSLRDGMCRALLRGYVSQKSLVFARGAVGVNQ